jgi:NADPH-dependent 2,4-dienoyl-CoA reductase/sulfur reductase-like enzyme
MEATVNKIDFAGKNVYASLKDGKEKVESYDKLILVTGPLPIVPGMPCKDLKGVQSLKVF